MSCVSISFLFWTANTKIFFVHCIVNQNTIERGKDEKEVKIAAGIEIQRVWRGYYTR